MMEIYEKKYFNPKNLIKKEKFLYKSVNFNRLDHRKKNRRALNSSRSIRYFETKYIPVATVIYKVITN